jgi:ribosome-binding factor A
MSQRRLEKMSELLRETIADLLLRKSKDPRLKEVNVTGVKVTADLKKAVVHYSVLGGDEAKAEAKKALDKAAGFVRAAVGENLRLKYSPEIKFEFDRNLEYAQHMNEVLNQLAEDRPDQEADESQGDD